MVLGNMPIGSAIQPARNAMVKGLSPNTVQSPFRVGTSVSSAISTFGSSERTGKLGFDPQPTHGGRTGPSGNSDPSRFFGQCRTGLPQSGQKASTLSGGEAQRIRLASQIGSGLVGVMYVLDEPTIGLHPRDTDRLIKTLKRLRDLGNT